MHDPLTDLPNRILVIERLKQAIEMAQRNNKRLAVFIIDLNNFKEINDTLGHPEGDIILQQVAQRLPQGLRGSDTIGRLGGDEFAVVLPDIDQAEACHVAQKLHASFNPSFLLHNQPIAIGASIGIAMYPDHGEEQAVLIRRADVAMYEAKKNDEGVMVYDHQFDQYTPKRLALMADLREAIDNNELELYYQPQIKASTGKVSCVEALLRWQHPEHGMIPPEQFIYMAENSGLINTLFDWVLNQALSDWKQWDDAGVKIEVSVNLSVRNLLDPNLAKRISEIQSRHQVPNYCLKLEITESAIMSNPEKVLQMMADPALCNLRYAIDDFGTGYSSLSYLKRLTVHEVKIDKSFVIDMHTNEEDASIVHSVIDLAHNLGHSVVAEGVESPDALDLLKILGCDYLQGFLFARPVPNSEILQVIKHIDDNADILAIKSAN
jgi:diguanylate cyclase (GGDEF)-like protein